MMNPTLPLIIYFDGLCPLCSREIDHYRQQEGHERLKFVDITEAEFDAVKEGLDPLQVHKVMHVRTPEGHLKSGVDSFIAIWQRLPKYHWLAEFAKKTWVRPFLDLGYHSFAVLRPYLPRKTRECQQSPYCETNSGAANTQDKKVL
jgi:predicted DCC family thiol-disulfide oxidoreductase YuxK